MKVSIVIPCYNLGEYLQDAVDSVKAQTYEDWELIIVDDGSTDTHTKKAVQKIETDNPDFLVFSKKNSGLAETKNYGIVRASGKYITCLDSDDMLAPDFLKKTIAVLEKDKKKKLAFVTTWLREFGERDNIWKASGFDIPKLLLNNNIHAGSVFRKDVWAKTGGFRKMAIGGYEDWDFWLSTVDLGYEWALVEEPLFLYRIRSNSMLVAAKSTHTDIYEDLFSAHKDLFVKYFADFVMENAKEARELHDIIRQKDQVISELDEYRGEVVTLREQVFGLRGEINSMKNSRVLGKIIKTRDFVGYTRKKASPSAIAHQTRAIAHQTRVVVAPFIPGPLRRQIKRQAKSLLKPSVKIIIQENMKWTDGLLVSVAIPFFNRADTIDDTLESLKAQTFKNFEIIVINDGSTEPESIKKLEELRKSNPKIIFINQENAGVAVARNNGISKARGKYIICLDSDDGLEPTYIEKATVVLEASPDISLVTTHMETFGVVKDPYKHIEYDPMQLIRNNMVITAAEYKKEAWENTGGYKSNIGYEDWEYWVNLAEHGFWGKLIPEPLFMYRTSMQSRYVDDKDAHWSNMKSIQKLHTQYKQNVKKLLSKRRLVKNIIDPATALMNIDDASDYNQPSVGKGNILIIVPWLTFGGAETLILNFTREVKDDFNLTFITGLQSEHEWEYKFKEITDRIYHLTNLFEEPELYLEFISNYVKTRNIDVIHIIHTDYAFSLLPELKQRHPKLKILVTLFNDRAAHFSKSLEVKDSIDAFSTDNNSVYKHYLQKLPEGADLRVIPNGINSDDTYNPVLFDRKKQRDSLGVGKDDLAVFFVGRMSEEKNPDIFLKAAENIVSKHNDVKFFLVGDGPMTPQLNKQIEAIGSKNVRHLGYQADVPMYLSSGDIFVLASSIEGFPLSILEAMAMRVAVVASDVGAVAEVINNGHDGFVVTPGSVDEIVEAIDKLRSSPKLLDDIKRNARQSVEKKYSNKILGANYRKLYRDLLK